MAENVIGIDIVARLDDFRAELAKIPDIGGKEAKALTAQLSKEIKAAESAAKKAADAAKTIKPAMDGAADATKRFGDNAGKLGSNAGKLAGILDTLVPGAGELARTVADVADAGEVASVASEGFGLSLGSILTVAGPVALAIGALALAYSHYKAELVEAERKQEQALHISEDVQTLTDQIAKSKRDLAKAVGGATAVEAENAEIQERWTEAGEKANKTLREKEAELKAALATEQRYVSDGLMSHQKTLDELTASLEQNAVEQKRNTDLASLGAQTDMDAREAARLKAEADAHATKNAAAKAEAAQDAAKAAEEEAKAQEEARRAALDYASAIEDIEGITHDAARSQMDDYELLADDRDKQLAHISESTMQAGQAAIASGEDVWGKLAEIDAKGTAASQGTWDAYYADLDALRQEDKDKAEKATDEKANQEKEALAQLYEQGASMAADAAGAISESFGDAYDTISGNVTDLMDYQSAADEHLTDSQKKALKERIKEQKKAAREAFEAQKAAAMVEAAIQTALAVSQSLGSAPWPYNLIPAGFALAAGLAEEAAIASTQPAFHSGGPLDLAPDEMSITARKGEYMVNPTGRSVLGDQTLRDANSGKSSSGGGNVYAVSVYKHTRQVDRWKKDGLLAGDPISKAITEGKLVGHRSNR